MQHLSSVLRTQEGGHPIPPTGSEPLLNSSTGPNGAHLRLGTSPVALPERLSTLVATLVHTRTGHAAIGDRGISP